MQKTDNASERGRDTVSASASASASASDIIYWSFKPIIRLWRVF